MVPSICLPALDTPIPEERLTVHLRQLALRTPEELEDRIQPHSSDELTASLIRNLSVLPIQTASKWVPGSGVLAHAIPATDEGKDFHELVSGNHPAIK